MTDRLFFLFSTDKFALRTYVKERKRLKQGKDRFLAVTPNNISIALDQRDYKIIHPIDLLGNEYTANAFKKSYEWQAGIAAMSVKNKNGSDGTVEDLFSFHEGLHANLQWAAKYTPYYHVRRIIIDTVFAAITRFPVDEYVFFGRDKWMVDLENIVTQCVKQTQPKKAIKTFEDVAPTKILPHYQDHLQSSVDWRAQKLNAVEKRRKTVLAERARVKGRTRVKELLSKPQRVKIPRQSFDDLLPHDQLVLTTYYDLERKHFKTFFNDNKWPGGFVYKELTTLGGKETSQLLSDVKQSFQIVAENDLDMTFGCGEFLDQIWSLPLDKKINPIFMRSSPFKLVNIDQKFVTEFVSNYGRYIIRLMELSMQEVPTTEIKGQVTSLRESLFSQLKKYVNQLSND